MAGVKKALEKLGGLKYALIVAAFGLALLLWPGGSEKPDAAAAEEELLKCYTFSDEAPVRPPFIRGVVT